MTYLLPTLADEARDWVEKHRLEISFTQKIPVRHGQIVGVPPKIMTAIYKGVTVEIDMAEFPSRSEIRAREWLLFQLAAPFLLTEGQPK